MSENTSQPPSRPSSPSSRPSSPSGRPTSPSGRPSSPSGRPSSPGGRPSSQGGRPSGGGYRPNFRNSSSQAPGKRRPFRRGFPRRKICRFCADKIVYIDYKNYRMLKDFLTERGKIIPRRISGNCAHHQRMLTRAIKRSRNIALLSFVHR